MSYFTFQLCFYLILFFNLHFSPPPPSQFERYGINLNIKTEKKKTYN